MRDQFQPLRQNEFWQQNKFYISLHLLVDDLLLQTYVGNKYLVTCTCISDLKFYYHDRSDRATL